MEDPPEDVAEQQIPVVGDDAEDDGFDPVPDEPPWEADPADVSARLRVVPVDESLISPRGW